MTKLGHIARIFHAMRLIRRLARFAYPRATYHKLLFMAIISGIWPLLMNVVVYHGFPLCRGSRDIFSD
jgi:hypothetical protein